LKLSVEVNELTLQRQKYKKWARKSKEFLDIFDNSTIRKSPPKIGSYFMVRSLQPSCPAFVGSLTQEEESH
jgi:hypothetical protein